MKDDVMLLIDGDLLCFQIAIAVQRKHPFIEGAFECDGRFTLRILEQKIRVMMSKFETGRIEFHFSCNREKNWRRKVMPEYKANRDGKLSPVGLSSLISYVMRSYPYVKEGILEADDTISMAATGKYKSNNIICSIDKDFLGVPTKIWNWNKKILQTQSKVDAFKFFIYQVIIGDSVDNFKGIPRIGPKGAVKFLATHTCDLYNIWEPLVKLGATKKCDEDYMLQQARVAYLLREGDYNWESKEIKLWTPEKIEEML